MPSAPPIPRGMWYLLLTVLGGWALILLRGTETIIPSGFLPLLGVGSIIVYKIAAKILTFIVWLRSPQSIMLRDDRLYATGKRPSAGILLERLWIDLRSTSLSVYEDSSLRFILLERNYPKTSLDTLCSEVQFAQCKIPLSDTSRNQMDRKILRRGLITILIVPVAFVGGLGAIFSKFELHPVGDSLMLAAYLSFALNIIMIRVAFGRKYPLEPEGRQYGLAMITVIMWWLGIFLFIQTLNYGDPDIRCVIAACVFGLSMVFYIGGRYTTSSRNRDSERNSALLPPLLVAIVISLFLGLVTGTSLLIGPNGAPAHIEAWPMSLASGLLPLLTYATFRRGWAIEPLARQRRLAILIVATWFLGWVFGCVGYSMESIECVIAGGAVFSIAFVFYFAGRKGKIASSP